MNIAASFPFAASANGSTAHIRFPRVRDEPVDLIPVMIFLDIKKSLYSKYTYKL
jgi:hypothetical protein